ncbi:MAG: bifunctional nuclease family protein [Bacteroidota bacterium]|nr:bifunctional nuclease family protein [Bacteroidota bacterium]
MKKVELEIYGIAPSHINGSYSLIMTEVDGDRKLPIIIGQFEAHAIAIPLEGINVERPLTHDLFITIAKKFNFTISEIVINSLKEGVFYSTLFCISESGTIQIDCRTSDAIAIAVRFNCPIYTNEKVMEMASIIIDEESVQKPGRDQTESPKGDQKEPNNRYKGKSLEELENLLDEALRNEDYLKAAEIRDIIDKLNE